MNNSELFTAAHKLAKTFEGDYVACFVLALEEIKNQNNNKEVKTLTFENGTIKLTLVEVLDHKQDYKPTHIFEVEEDGDVERVGINMNTGRNLASWLDDNCGIEGTIENVESFKTLLK